MMPNPKGISKEFLRSVCEPFFDQMLVAVHQALQEQSQQALQVQGVCQSMQVAPASMNQQGLPCEERSTDDDSDVSDSGAFSSIFTPLSTEVEDHAVKNGQQAFTALMCSADALSKVNCVESDNTNRHRQEVESDAEHGSDQEKSVMVCRHWKSKGWCRMEENCKFLHPEHKRGVGFGNGNKAVGISGGSNPDISSSLVHDSNPSDELALIAADGKKKSGKKRKNKNKASGLKEDFTAPFPGHAPNVQLAVGGYTHSGLNVHYPALPGPAM